MGGHRAREQAKMPKGSKDRSAKWRGQMAGAGLSPHRCSARGSWKEGTSGRRGQQGVSRSPQPSRHSRLLLGPRWRVPTPLKIQAKPQPTPPPCQPQVMTAGGPYRWSQDPWAITLNSAAVSTHQFHKAPLHTAPRAGHRDREVRPHTAQGSFSL